MLDIVLICFVFEGEQATETTLSVHRRDAMEVLQGAGVVQGHLSLLIRHVI